MRGVSNPSNGGMTTNYQNQSGVKNGQRVSQQRRFNNTTLDNYQQQIQANQLSTIQANASNMEI